MALILLSGCKKNRIEEGVIHYDVSFPYASEEGLMGSMLPKKMKLKFDKDRYVTELTAGMGMFKMRFIADNEGKILRHTLDMMKEKIMVEMNEKGVEQMLEDFPDLRIVPSRERDSLADIPCKKALGFYADRDEPPMDIFYTDRIALKDPNWCNPYRELEGVLMGYEIKRFGKRMQLRAEKVEAKEIPEKAFSTEEYEKVSVEEMNRTMKKLMKSLE
jgi:hypothetical protein